MSLTFLTEVTSNTATTQMILPILASLGVAMGENPLLLMIPATLSASCAFMMPVATPPNAIVFGSGRVKIGDMVKAGFFINIIGVIVISLLFYFLGTAVFSIDPGVQPDWARLTARPREPSPPTNRGKDDDEATATNAASGAGNRARSDHTRRQPLRETASSGRTRWLSVRHFR